MAVLEIKGKELVAKCTFRFDKLADSKYNDEDKEGNKTGGFMSIYMNLLEYSNKHLAAFWDCGLDYLIKDKPSVAEIEAAIEARIEVDGDTELLFKEAFEAIDQSGFFKKKAKNFWKDLEFMKTTGKDDDEKAENLKMYNLMLERRKELSE